MAGPTPKLNTLQDSFKVVAEQRGSTLVVRAWGELDLSWVAELEAVVEQEGGDQVQELILDLRGLRFIDSSGIRSLLAIEGRSRDEGFSLSVVPGEGQVERVFRAVGLDQAIPIQDASVLPPAAR